LVLAVDASISMGEAERLMQVRGYVEALRATEFVSAIGCGAHGRIALAYLEWAGPEIERVLVPWALIDGPESANGFAHALENAPVECHNSMTGLSDALIFAAGMFSGNGFVGDRQVIDISGDGVNNIGLEPSMVRDALVRQGITINGLPIHLPGANRPIQGTTDVRDFYRASVIGGPGAFAIDVADSQTFASAIHSKLVREVA
ncbi:MAG: DUF1194 domain-containing protein, partial [Bradyrhizobium sp.]